ncbi:MAG: hypothetical protein VB051_07050 [Candidatus Pelethousia sp.]|nr:hypothetical protein [Candidatus Pelethousia sp.]
MKDFILAALPWIALGVSVALVIVFSAKRFRKDRPQTETQSENGKQEETYMTYGMCCGMCFGTAIGSALMGSLGTNALTYCTCLGMLAGLVIGLNIKKR